jgi:hypothetical protein
MVENGMKNMSEDMVAARDFLEGYEDATFGGPRVPDGTYHVKVAENLGQPDWSTDGERPVVELGVEIASGDYAGEFAPRIRLQLGGFSFHRKKKDGTEGKFVEVTADKVFSDLQGLVRIIHGPSLPAGTVGLKGVELLEALAEGMVGDEYIVDIVKNARTGYQDQKNYCSIDEPPDGFMMAGDLEEFSVV